jgi:hypothetical protein
MTYLELRFLDRSDGRHIGPHDLAALSEAAGWQAQNRTNVKKQPMGEL